MTREAKQAAAAWRRLSERAAEEWKRQRGPGQRAVIVGDATCGRSAGALKVIEAAREEVERLGIEALVMRSGCLGHCYAEPMALLQGPDFPPILYGYLTPEKARVIVRKLYTDGNPMLEWCIGAMEGNDRIPSIYENERFRREERRLLRRCGLIDPENIFHAIWMGCYEGFVRSLGMDPRAIIEEVKRSGLRGMGGAGFPTWKKWETCAGTAADKRYVVCNADEGDPGAFMDRAILESDPHAVIEGMLIAARAIGSRHGYIYIRREYPLAVERFRKALKSAVEAGLLGGRILGSNMDFSILVMEGAGAFVCGESTALIHSLEGKRGMPRVRPPRSAVSGLNGKPTLLSNVKTFASCGLILGRSASWFSSIGTEGSKGTAVFALAGKIRNTGLVEVPMGTSVRDVVEIFGGGVPPYRKSSEIEGDPGILKKKRFKAVQIGGPSGGWIPERLLDTKVDFDSLQGAGAMMGSGGMVVLDEDNCIVAATRFFLEFTQRESCGKCTFCRIGTWHMLKVLEKITRGEASMEDIDLLEELASDVKKGSLCNLGRTAPNPVLASLAHFREEYEAHVKEKRCPSLQCQDLVSYVIILERCHRTCEACVGSCPTEAIFTRKDVLKEIRQDMCIRCGACMAACPSHHDAVVRVSPRNSEGR